MILPVCLFVHQCVEYHRGQKRISDPLKLDWQMVVSLCAVARNQSQVWTSRSSYLPMPDESSPALSSILKYSCFLLYTFYVFVCVLLLGVPCVCESWKLLSDPLGLEWQVVLSHLLWMLRTQFQSSARGTNAFYHWAVCLVAILNFFIYCRLKCFPSSNIECVLIECIQCTKIFSKVIIIALLSKQEKFSIWK